MSRPAPFKRRSSTSRAQLSLPFPLYPFLDSLPLRYLSHHPSQVLRNFFLTVTKWEAEEIAILGSRPQVQPPQPNLSRLPPSLIHLLLLSPALTQIPSMHDMFVRASKSTFNSSDAESHLDGRFPAVGEGLLELLLQQPRSPPPASDEEDPPLESDIFPHLSVRNLAKLLLPPVKSITLPGLAKSLPTIERLLAVISSSSSDAGANFGEAWEVLSLVLERLDGDALKMGLVGGFGGAGKDALERGDRWLDEVCGGRSRWTRTVGIVCSHLGEDSECEQICLRLCLGSLLTDYKSHRLSFDLLVVPHASRRVRRRALVDFLLSQLSHSPKSHRRTRQHQKQPAVPLPLRNRRATMLRVVRRLRSNPESVVRGSTEEGQGRRGSVPGGTQENDQLPRRRSPALEIRDLHQHQGDDRGVQGQSRRGSSRIKTQADLNSPRLLRSSPTPPKLPRRNPLPPLAVEPSTPSSKSTLLPSRRSHTPPRITEIQLGLLFDLRRRRSSP